MACRDDAVAAGLLTELADRVLCGGAGDSVVALEAPEWPAVPEALRRADGRSLYRPHGTRYATLAQLTMEERLAFQAQQTGAPRLAPEVAARLLGADQAQLEAQLQAAAQTADTAQETTGSGLTMDQAAAAFVVLTSDRRAEILVGPAGSGKTRVAGEIARMWRAAGLGEVYGLTTSQAARNVLRAAGVDLADNTAEFLGHLAGQREARGPKTLRPGTLLLLDEASMMSLADLASIMRLATERGCRVLITGDHEQLAAVEGGGGMMKLARRLGFVQLAEPVRFESEWERDATLRLRLGDVSVLAEYDQQGRLRGGGPEEAAELACRGWLADHLAGLDALLLTRTGEQARELSRRIRDDLIRYGLVTTEFQVGLRYGAVASRGDLIVARRNDRRVKAGEPGRWLTNRDVLRVRSASGRTVTVGRLAGRDPLSSRAVWSGPFELPRAYLFSHCDLAYATTPHAVQSRTVDTSHVLVDGLGDRQGLYVAMSQGRRANYAYCVTDWHRAADVRAGSRPAPELARGRRLVRERAGLPPEPARRKGAHHLGVLGSIWYDLARRAQRVRFEMVMHQNLTAADAESALADRACTWLWRSLREAEAAGLDGGEMLQAAIASRSLYDARDIARVIDARIRRILQHTVPQVRAAWSERIPEMGDPDLDRFMTELAAAMDDRVRRIGEHAAQTQPMWATGALGDVPADPARRLEWEQRAARLGAYRELYGCSAPGDAIGPEPGKTSPEARADWHSAFEALGKVDGIDMRGYSDAQLRLQRATYEQETGWAPPYVGEELRLARLQARTAFENATRERYETRAARNHDAAQQHQQLARAWRAMEARATAIAQTLAVAQETRNQWAALTEPTRRVAVAADLELRRRHPDEHLEPLRSAEPDAVPGSESQRPLGEDVWVQPTLDGAVHLADGALEPNAHEEPSMIDVPNVISGQQSLRVTPEASPDVLPERVLQIRDNARTAQATIDELRGIRVPGEDHEAMDLGPAWSILAVRDRAAIIQPPRPEVVPASAILRHANERTAAREPERA